MRKVEAITKSEKLKYIKDSRKDSERSLKISYSQGEWYQGRLREKVSTIIVKKSHLYESNAGKLRKMARKS